MGVVEATFKGASEIGFTVLSMSTSLVAVFIPLLMMGGIVGRLFREFAVTLSVAIGVSLVVSLTTTPTMCAKFLRVPKKDEKHNIFYRSSEWAFDRLLGAYDWMLKGVLRFQLPVLVLTMVIIGFSVYLYIVVPKGFFPQQDTGRVGGSVIGAQDVSFQSMSEKMRRYIQIVMADPAVDTMAGFTGGQTASNQGRFFVMLKPLEQRGPCQKKHFWNSCHYPSADEVINGLRSKLAVVPGATLILQSQQELTIGGRFGNAQYQYTLQSADISELNTWAPRLLETMRKLKELRDQNSDQQDKGLQAKLVIDRDTASRMGITPQTLDNALYDAFGQRQVSTMYRPLNQYHVVMEVAPQFQQTPEALQNIYLKSTNGGAIPLAAFTHFEPSNTPLAVNHQGQIPSATISFNLAPGVSLGEATAAIEAAERSIGFPPSITASFQGTAAAFQESQSNMELHWGSRGEVYVTPVSSEQICVALISRDPKLRLAEALWHLPELQARLEGVEAASTEKGAVTATSRLKRVSRGNIALIGDASGSVDAITGEGLCLAFHQASVLAECLDSGDLSRYEKEHRRLALRPRLMARLMLVLDRRPRLQRRIVQAFVRHPSVFHRLLELHVGVLSPLHLAVDGLTLGWGLLTA